jgi:hypothetical protein
MSGNSYARRAVLRSAAGAGAIGLVAAAGVGTVAAASASAATATPEQDHAPVVVYLRDASSGELEIFSGTSRTQVHDPALAARLARAISVR